MSQVQALIEKARLLPAMHLKVPEDLSTKLQSG